MYRCEHGVFPFGTGCRIPCKRCGHRCDRHPMGFCIDCDKDCLSDEGDTKVKDAA